MKNTHSDWKQAAVSLLGKIQDAFKNDCCIPCYQCYKLQNEIEALLSCVQPERDCRTQTALRPAYDTQQESIWHTVDDVPMKKRPIMVVLALEQNMKEFRVYQHVSVKLWKRGVRLINIIKWAYIDELEAL